MFFVGSGEASQIIARVNRQERQLREYRAYIDKLEEFKKIAQESMDMAEKTKAFLVRENEALKRENRLLTELKETYENLG